MFSSSYLEEQAAQGFGQSYAPQSGAIFGILKQMKETSRTTARGIGSDHRVRVWLHRIN